MKKIIVSVVTALAAIIALAAVGLWWFETRSWPVFLARDAVQVIAYAASDMFIGNPATTPEEIEATIKHLHDASVINLRINQSGKAVDPFGTPFRVQYERHPETSVTTVTSAGPDRRFGTTDDIRFVHEVECKPQQGADGDAVNRAP